MARKMRKTTAERSRSEGLGSPQMTRLFFLDDQDLRLLLFGGKGGVGKTTCAAAAALRYADSRPDASILLVSTDPAHSLADSLAGDDIPSNLRVIELDAGEYLNRFRQDHADKLRKIAQRGTFFDDDDIDSALNLSLPGMDELMAFLQIMRWMDEDGYDRIIVDTAPTGHTLRLLTMPDLVRTWLGALDTLLAKYRYMKTLLSGFYKRDELDIFIEDMASSAKRMKSLLGDQARCRFVPVMISEALSVMETGDLAAQLKRAGVAVTDIVVNRLYPAGHCVLCGDIRARQLEQLREAMRGHSRLASYIFWGIPVYGAEIRGRKMLMTFWDGATRLSPETVAIPSSPAEPADAEGGIRVGLSAAPCADNPAPLPGAGMRLLLFAGKGGVGKTTLASATAARMAKERHRRNILIVSADPAHSLSDCFDMKIGRTPAVICEGLSALEIDAQAEFDSLKKQYAKELKHLFSFSKNLEIQFDEESIERLLDLSPPGLDEVMALTRLMEQLGNDRHDLIILDTAPTGHLIRLIELPQIIEDWLKFIFSLFLKYRHVLKLPSSIKRLIDISKNLKALRAMLANPARSALYIAAIPTEMALAETQDLYEACNRMTISAPVIFLNMLTFGGNCPLCQALVERESLVRNKFDQIFDRTHRTAVYRHKEPRGLQSLTVLGMELYQQPENPLLTINKGKI